MKTTSDKLSYLSDQETAVDLLNNEAIATTVLRLITNKSDQPITIGIHGDWGAGKSSVLEMVEGSLKADTRSACVKVNGWQFQGFEDAKIALIQAVVHELVESRSLLTKAGDSVRQVWRSIDKLKLAKGVGKLALALKTGVPLQGLGLTDMVEAFGSSAADVLGDEDQRHAVAEGFKGLVPHGLKLAEDNVPKDIADFRNAFRRLIEAADIDRLVVLVDDLDRCLPETAVETLEAIRLFVLMRRTVFIVGADERMIEYAVRRHFPHFPSAEGGEGYARAYLEKLIQVPFRIPVLGETETRVYVTLLLLGATLGENDPRFGALLDLGREALGRPWDATGMRGEDVRRVLGDASQAVQDALVTAERISPVLASGTKGNPRQVKRFLNALTLRLAVAEARRFGDAINPAHLAKFMLAERFLPGSVFDQIASSAAASRDGTCPAIAEIEAFVDGRQGGETEEGYDPLAAALASAGEPSEDAPEVEAVDDTTLADWKTRSDVLTWARVRPGLGGVDLRPYLFVIKDQRNYLTGGAILSSGLRVLVDKLCAGSLSAGSTTGALKALSTPDLSAVFEALRTNVLTSEDLSRKPSALVGMEHLVQVIPTMQGRYLDLLEGLPAERLGVWVATGHAFVKEDRLAARLAAMKERWSRTGSTPLKRALTIRGSAKSLSQSR